MTSTRSIRSIRSRNSIRPSLLSRRSSVDRDESFDDHLPDSPFSIDDEPLGYFPPPRQQQYSDNPQGDSQSAPEPPIASTSQQPERSSTVKHRLMIDDAPSASNGVGRSLSTSSRITIPRSTSPYDGPTAPSHPYHMYPQMTRASSIASQSTARPASRASYVPRAGPQHPYHMFPQNTAPDETEDITSHGMPLGFPSTNFQGSSSGGSSSDMGDIIGADGHIERLPPYTRYADNTVAKGNMEGLDRRRSTITRTPSQTASSSADTITNAAPPSIAPSTQLLRPTELFEEETEAQRARKEGYRGNWKDTLMIPTLAGMPLWGLLLIVIIVIMSAVVGGVVGGIIGNKQGAQRAYANGALTTIWLDAMPTSLGPNASPLPTGHYQIPFNQTEEVNNCIPNKEVMGAAWGCMDIAYIGVNVYNDQSSGQMQAAFEDFSVNTADFQYGPQPPDFNGTAFTLQPMVDKDANDLGVAMFFSVLFDKLSIVPENALQLNLNKREANAGQFNRRGPAVYDGQPLQPSDRPWFCFWNSTINEFFIYLNEEAHPTTTTTTTGHKAAMQTGPPNSMITSFTSTSTSNILIDELTMSVGTTAMPTSFAAYNPVYNSQAVPTSINKRQETEKKDYGTSAPDMTNYPKLIKMVEKRKPADTNALHVKPYCQKMQVLDDWEIVPIKSVETVCIEEMQFPTSKSTMNPTKHKRRFDRDVVADLESYCICEWTSQ